MTPDRRRWLSEALRSCALVALAVCTSVVPFSSGTPSRFGSPQTPLVLICSAAFLSAGEAFLSRRTLRLPWQLWIPILAFFALVLLSVLRASYAHAALLAGAQWFGHGLLFFLIVQLVRRPEEANIMLAVLVATASAVAAYAVYQYFFGLQLTREMLAASPELLRTLPPELRTAFEGRAFRTERAFGTFITPNSLAGFLLLLWPSAVALGLWALRNRARWWARLSASFAAAVILAAMFLTKSKGGWVGLLASVFVFAVLFATSKQRRFLLYLGGAGCFVAILGLAALRLPGVDDLRLPRPFAASLGVRLGYWRGAAEMIRHAPLMGIGLEGFADRYLPYKPASSHEAAHAHNDHLQIWAEMGTLGFLAWVCIWVAYFWAILRGGASEPPAAGEPEGLSLRPLYVFLPGAFLSGYLGTWIISLFFIIWLVCFWPTKAAIEGARSLAPASLAPLNRLIRIGALSGIAGFLVHSFADLNNYVPTIGQSAWALMAVSLATAPPAQSGSRRSSPVAAVLLGLGFIMTGTSLATFSIPEARAGALMRSANDQARLALEMFDEGRLAEAVARAHVGLARLERAGRWMPLSAEVPRRRASLYARLWFWGQEYFGGQSTFEQAEEEYLKALDRRPESSGIYGDLAALHRRRAMIVGSWTPAWYRSASEAAKRYPANPRYLLDLGDASGALGDEEQRARYYRKALELDAEVPHEWLRLPDEDRDRLTAELQRYYEAQGGRQAVTEQQASDQ